MKLSLKIFWLVLWCWTQRVPILQTMKLCHLSEEAIRHWFRQFRMHLPYFEPILAGKVQMDEAYFKSLSLILAKQLLSRLFENGIIYKVRKVHQVYKVESKINFITLDRK